MQKFYYEDTDSVDFIVDLNEYVISERIWIMPKRLCIFSIYDAEGIVDEYIFYFLEELRKVATEIIIVSNGAIQEKSAKQKLQQFAEKVVIRDNVGFDGGAYKDIILNHIGKLNLEIYDELILCNDTCYGPFVCMTEVFNRMESKDSDFWGLHIWDEGYTYWMNSCFVVLKKRILSDDLFYNFLQYNIDENSKDISDAYGGFEMALFKTLKDTGYRYDAMVSDTRIHMMKSPDVFIEKYRLPFMKRRSFCKQHYHENNLRKALSLIQKMGYDVNYILDNAKRRFEISQDILNKNFRYTDPTDEMSVDYADVLPEEIIAFIQEHANFDIYIWCGRIWE